MTDQLTGRAARRVPAVLAAVLTAAALLLVGAPAQAADEPQEPAPTTPTFVLCAQGHNSGRLLAVRAIGPGQLLVVGAAKPCRRPSALDAVSVAAQYPSHPAPGIARTLAGTDGTPTQRIVRYRNQLAGRFVDVVQVHAGANRVCLADNPKHGLDCVAIRVPATRNGGDGVPVVGGHTTTAGVSLPQRRPFCATCW